MGGMGDADLDISLKFRDEGLVNVAAVCEVDTDRLIEAAKRVGDGCQTYDDYRKLLERPDLDGVVIATPDHWHARQTIDACRAGKHVYVEKPASCTVADGRAMVVAARENQRVVQVGSQARSAEPAHQVCTYVRNGMLGRVRKVTCWHSPNPTGGPSQQAAPPADARLGLLARAAQHASVRTGCLSPRFLPLDHGIGRRRNSRPRCTRNECDPLVSRRRQPVSCLD